MMKGKDISTFFIQRREVIILTGLICWIANVFMQNEAVFTWRMYGTWLLPVFLVLSPVLFFFWQKEKWKATLRPARYRQYWIACFLIYLPLLIIIGFLLAPGGVTLVFGAFCGLLLELTFLINNYFQSRLQHRKWVQRFSLEKALLISLAFLAILLAAMAVSSIGNPAYDLPDHLMAGPVFDIGKIIRYFWTFLAFATQFMLMYLTGYFLYYLNSRILVARVLKQYGLVMYILSGIAVVGILYPVLAQLLTWLPVNVRMGNIFSDNPFEEENAFAAGAILVLSLPIVLAMQWSKQNSKIMSLEKEKTQAELDLLKQQLNPHFFFNTLNNLYALSLQQSAETPESILQLSELMRYVIYKAKEPFVQVKEEVQYIRGYMDLQQIRLKRPPEIQFTTEIAADTPPVAPLLLIVFIENAFKHGIEPAEGTAFLHVQIKADRNRLYFYAENSFEEGEEHKSGIGLDNLKKRLALLYPGKHQLKTGSENRIFKAELELDFL